MLLQSTVSPVVTIFGGHSKTLHRQALSNHSEQKLGWVIRFNNTQSLNLGAVVPNKPELLFEAAVTLKG